MKAGPMELEEATDHPIDYGSRRALDRFRLRSHRTLRRPPPILSRYVC